MDELFTDLTIELNELNRHLALSDKNLNENSISYSEPTDDELAGWNEFVSKFQEQKKNIENALSSPYDINNPHIKTRILFFRPMTRWFSEVACTWSIEYPQIRTCLTKVFSQARKIDEKYYFCPY